MRDLQAYNYQDEYMKGLNQKIRNVEKHAIRTELTMALLVGTAQMILKLGIATVALTGGYLLAQDKLDVITFFLFLMVVSRIYDPMQVSLQNLAAINSAKVQSQRLDEILSHDLQEGSTELTNKGYDIEFHNVGFSYNEKETVLSDVPLLHCVPGCDVVQQYGDGEYSNRKE